MIRKITHRKPLLWIGALVGIVLLVISAVAIFLGTRSDEWWRDKLTATLSQTLGREVEIQGPFRLDLGRRLDIEAAALRIANPEWAESRDMLRVGSLLLEIDLFSVIGDTLRVNRLELADIELALVENQNGEQNWAFATETEAEPPPKRKPGEAVTLPVHVEKLSLQQAQLSLNQPGREHPLVLQVDSISGGQTPDDEVVFAGSGRLADLPFTLKGSFGRLSDVLNAGPASYQLSGKLGKTGLHSKGSIESLVTPLRPKLDLTLSGADITQITRAMGTPAIAKGAFEAHVNVAPGGRGVRSQIKGKLGKLRLDADFSNEDLTSAENMGIRAQLSGENLAAVAKQLGIPPLPKGSFAINGVLQRDKGSTRIEKMIASVGKHQISVVGTVGQWPELKDTRLELRAQGPNLAVFTPSVAPIGLGKLPAGAYSVNTLIESSETGFHVRPSKLTAGGYKATAEGHVTTKDQIQAELNVTGSGPDLSMISRLADTIQLPAWPFQAKGRIDITSDNITLVGTSGTAGKHEVAVDGPIAFSAEGPVRLDVKGSGPSLQAVLKGLGYDVIPASAAYQIEGKVEFAGNQVEVAAKHARLGPADASATVRIPDLNTPTILIVDVGKLKTTDVSAALALVGVKLDLPQVIPANLRGRINRNKDTTGFSKVRGTVGAASVKVDGIIGSPPKYKNTRVSLDIAGPNLERFLPHPIEQAIPFKLKGRLESAKGYTRIEDLQLKLANIEARAHGQVGSWEKIAGTELSISAQGPNLDVVAAVLNRSLPAGEVKFDGHVSGAKDAFHIDRMNAQWGRSNLSGDLKLTRGKPPLLKGRVRSSHLDASLFKKELESEAKSASTDKTLNSDSTEIVADAAPQGEQTLLFPDTPIELEVFDQLDLDLDIRIDELVKLSERGALQDLSAKVLLKGRDLTVSNFEGGGPLGSKITGNLAIKPDAEFTRFNVDIRGEQLRIGLAAAPGQDPATFPPVDVEANLTGTGDTYHKLAASLDGRIKMVQGEGRINNNSMAILLSDVFYELFQTVNPMAKAEPTTRMDCGVYIINLEDGSADIQALVIQTDKLTIVSAGKVDLKTEQINIGFNTRPRKGVGISVSAITNPYMRLGGSLAKPAIALDAGGATVATGAAVATGGLSFLFKGVWDRYFTARDPCGKALEHDAELQAKKAKQQAKEPPVE